MTFAWILIILLVWYGTEKWLEKELDTDRMRSFFIMTTPFFILFLCQAFGVQENWTMMLKTGLFISLCFLVGCYDYYTCTIPRFSHYLILCTALIGSEKIIALLIAGVLLSLPFLILYLVAFFSKKKSWIFGLGDLLFIASGSFFLGIVPGFVGIMSGLLLFLVWSAVNGKKEQLPLAPALSIGYMLGLYIM